MSAGKSRSTSKRPRPPLLRGKQVLGLWLTGTPQCRCMVEQFLDNLLESANVRLEEDGPTALRLVVDNTSMRP